MGILINFEEELKKVGLTPESYEAACEDIDLKSDGVKTGQKLKINTIFHFQVIVFEKPVVLFLVVHSELHI